jgi:hypothetical protein
MPDVASWQTYLCLPVSLQTRPLQLPALRSAAQEAEPPCGALRERGLTSVEPTTPGAQPSERPWPHLWSLTKDGRVGHRVDWDAGHLHSEQNKSPGGRDLVPQSPAGPGTCEV